MTSPLDGVLVVDKPEGPTSHDVIVRLRRALRIRRIGHTGTLDPMATGVLPVVIGRATRLARFLSGAGKAYRAAIRLGFATDTDDASGTPLDPRQTEPGDLPSRAEVTEALEKLARCTVQLPPVYSAKKLSGLRAYERARDGTPVQPAPVNVTVDRLDLVSYEGDIVTVDLACSAGFYVRSLARDLGTMLGTGAHLAALRRTRSGTYGEERAVPLEEVEKDPGLAADRLQRIDEMLEELPALRLTPGGVRRARNGQNVGPDDGEMLKGTAAGPAAGYVRLFGPDGTLVSVAKPAGKAGVLHPAVVLM